MDVIDEFISDWFKDLGDEYVLAVEAQKIVQRLRETRPQDLAMWLDDRAEDVVHAAARSMSQSWRNTARRRAGAREFGEVARSAPETIGDVFAMSRFAVDTAGTWKPLGAMTGVDHRFVAKSGRCTIQARRQAAALRRMRRLVVLARQLVAAVERGDRDTVEALRPRWERMKQEIEDARADTKG